MSKKINFKKIKEIIKKESSGKGNFADFEELKRYADFFLTNFAKFKKEEIIWYFENQRELEKIYLYRNIDYIIFYLKHFHRKTN